MTWQAQPRGAQLLELRGSDKPFIYEGNLFTRSPAAATLAGTPAQSGGGEVGND